MITNEQLYKRVNELAVEKWGVRFSQPCEIVKNLNAHGMFSAEFDGYGKIKPIGIKISYNLMQYHPKNIIDGVILHELCHWILLIKGRPNGDKDIEFFIEMRKVGGIFPFEIPRIGYFHIVKCSCCEGIIGTEDTRERCKKRMRGLESLCCNATLKYGGFKFLNMAIQG